MSGAKVARVLINEGAAGVDGLDIEQAAQTIRQRWPEIRQALLAGSYRPSPVRKVMIPKPDGSQRELGIPMVLDRLIQQATSDCQFSVGGNTLPPVLMGATAPYPTN